MKDKIGYFHNPLFDTKYYHSLHGYHHPFPNELTLEMWPGPLLESCPMLALINVIS